MNNRSSTLPLLVLSRPADELNSRWCDSCTQRRVASRAWASAGEITREQAGMCRNQQPSVLPASGSSPLPPAKGEEPDHWDQREQ